ncbi:MAG: TetR/AcrR family transcriptional regulator [Acidimicrobiales bacterium]
MSRRAGVALGRRPSGAADAQSTRDVVLDAAQTCFRRYGIAGATIEDVVRVAKVPRATLYRHAGGKDALVAAVGLRQLERFLDELAEHVAACATTADHIVEGAMFTIEHYRTDELLGLLLAPDAPPSGPRIVRDSAEQARRLLVAAIEPWIDAGHAAGELRAEVSADDYVEWTMRIVGSLVLSPPRRTPDEERAFLHRVLVPSFVPDAAR